jgi:hypothetical protein
VGENIVSAYQVGVMPGGTERLSLGRIKKRNISRYSSALRHSGYISCGFNPKHGDSSLNEIVQQITIITPYLDDPATLIYAKTPAHEIAVAPCMIEPTVGKR